MLNYLNQAQPVIISDDIPSNNDTTDTLLNILTQTAVRIKGKGAGDALRKTLIKCLELCPLPEIKYQLVKHSYDAGVHAFKHGLSRNEIENLEGYDVQSWLRGYDNAALGASKALREITQD